MHRIALKAEVVRILDIKFVCCDSFCMHCRGITWKKNGSVNAVYPSLGSFPEGSRCIEFYRGVLVIDQDGTDRI